MHGLYITIFKTGECMHVAPIIMGMNPSPSPSPPPTLFTSSSNMDPPATANHQNTIDLHWFHYFEDNLPLLVDEPLELQWENWFESVAPPLNQQYMVCDELGLEDFDLSLWGLWDDDDVVSDVKPKGGKVGRRSRRLELEEIEKHFEMPIAMAAKELNVGLTVLKKRCRELGIKRWPHTKLKSLGSLIQNVEEMGLKEEMEVLKEEKKMMEKLPEMELTQTTKKLRQACFKFNYKKKRRLHLHH